MTSLAEKKDVPVEMGEATTPERDSETDLSGKDTWKCPDPGCKKSNIKSSVSCIQCQLPRNSAHQFKKDRRRNKEETVKPQKQELVSTIADTNEETPTVQMFRELSKKLDDRHEKYERIVKINRDITICSKRVIFKLHRIQSPETDVKILKESSEELHRIRTIYWTKIADELDGEDPYRFLKAYTGGLQEYVEAVSFYHFIHYNELVPWQKVQEELIFEDETEGKEAPPKQASSALPEKKRMVHVPKTDFFLGIADLTGEIMRRVINSIGFGDTSSCFRHTDFLHEVYNGFKLFEGIRVESKEMKRKISTALVSLKKCEAACYAINLRGSEIPKHMFAEILSKREREDAGFANSAEDHAYFEDDY